MRPKPLIAKLAIGNLKVEELNRYAEKLQRPTRVFSKQSVPVHCHVERSETSLIIYPRGGRRKTSEILRFAQNDTEHAFNGDKPINAY
jgi:hypothetical protein